MPDKSREGIADFFVGLNTTTKPFQRFESEDIEETKGAMQTIAELTLVLDFLDEHGAPEYLSDAVETAMGDVYAWVGRDIQGELMRLVSNSGFSLVPKAFLSLQQFVERQNSAETPTIYL